MKSSSKLETPLLVVGTTILACACLLTSCQSTNYYPSSTINAELMFIVRSVNALAFEEPTAFGAIVTQQPKFVFDYGLCSAATNALASSYVDQGTDFRIFPSGRDPWGSPYAISISQGASAPREANDSGRNKKVFKFSVWTLGPNKRNEQGSGDDWIAGPFEATSYEGIGR